MNNNSKENVVSIQEKKKIIKECKDILKAIRTQQIKTMMTKLNSEDDEIEAKINSEIHNLDEKLKNISGKTGQYDVPTELYQMRTKRNNRCLISWGDVYRNRLTLDQLNTFEGGVVVEFVNDDYYNEEYFDNELFKTLKARLGSDEKVSSIISLRKVDGDSGAAKSMEAFKKFIGEGGEKPIKIKYNGKTVKLTRNNYNCKEYIVHRKDRVSSRGVGSGNEKWTGFLFVSIKGGDNRPNSTFETHEKQNIKLFNPACEYASEEVSRDIDLVMLYFVMHSIKKEELNQLTEDLSDKYNLVSEKLDNALKKISYKDIKNKKRSEKNLYDYCSNHYSIIYEKGCLYDTVVCERIGLENFCINSRINKAVDFSHYFPIKHEEGENKVTNFYFDDKKNTILSATQPINVFWLLHIGNMIQGDSTLEQVYKNDKKRVKNREKYLGV